VEILQETNSRSLLAYAHSMMSMGLVALGKHRLARRQGEIAVSIADQCRSLMTRFVATSNLVESTCRFGLLGEAMAHSRRTMELMAEVHNPVSLHESYAVLSEARVTSGDYAGAREMLAVLSADVQTDLAVYSRSRVHYIAAWMLYLVGDFASALQEIEVLKMLHTKSGPVFEYELGEAIRAAVLRSQGRRIQSQELLLELLQPAHACRHVTTEGAPFALALAVEGADRPAHGGADVRDLATRVALYLAHP
jgi:hypothetical protein